MHSDGAWAGRLPNEICNRKGESKSSGTRKGMDGQRVGEGQGSQNVLVHTSLGLPAMGRQLRTQRLAVRAHA